MNRKQTITKSALVPTVLISGGAGFIGSHLAEYLLQNKARVVVLDNFKTGKEIHVKHLLEDKNFALYDVDINVSIPPEIESVDYIFHLAGLEEYFYSKDYLSLDSLFTNSLGTKNLLDLANKSSAKFLLASTIDVYQGRISQVDIEKYFGTNSSEENRFSLIEAKRFAEAMVWEYHKKHDVDVRIVRLPEVYGPRMDLSSSGFLGGYIKSVLEGSSIEIYGDGIEKEFYLYISDVISGIIRSQFEENTKGKIFSLVPESSVSALESAYLVRSVADSRLSIQFRDSLSNIVQEPAVPDTINLKDIGWKPKVSLKEGIIKTLEFFDYSPNTHAFKPGKLVEQKIKSADVLPGSIVSLQGVKITSKPKDSPPDEIFSYPEEEIKPKEKKKRKFRIKEIFRKKTPKEKKVVKRNILSFGYRVKADMGYALAIFAVIISALLVFVGIPAASAYFNIKKGTNSLQNVRDSLVEMDSDSFSSEITSVNAAFRSGRSSFNRLKWAFNLFGMGDRYNSYEKSLNSLIFFSKAGMSAGSAVKTFDTVLQSIRPDNPSIINDGVFEGADLSISTSRDYLAMAEAEILGVDSAYYPEKYRYLLDEYVSFLSQSQDIAKSLSSVMPGLPQALGVNGEKKYIIWFQNSNEIRPTGGFIGSYAVVRLESGKIKDLFIDDIYNPDGQIDVRNIKTTPPEPIRDFLEEETLYLRNSNWNPDFTRSAKAFDDIYFKITGETIDGYIAIDLDFVEGLLEAMGPVFLATYNEDISAENLDERAQYYSGFDYKEGESDKKSFLTVLGGKLLERIFTLNKENTSKVAEKIAQSLDQRHLQIYFSNNPMNSLLRESNWDGALIDTEGDYLFVVNANLGGTKSNYYIDNRITYDISSMTRDGLLRANLYLDYKNNAEDASWPGGPYTDYVRVLTQNGSKLTGAKFVYENGEESDVFEDIVVTNIGKYTSFETSFVLDPQSIIRLVLSYDLPEKLSITKDQGAYSLFWQKQAGTSGDEFNFIFNPPFGSVVESKSDSLEYFEGSFRDSGVLSKNLDYTILLK
jgi:nucleoside-diphosphate-sugar epimerase